MKPVPPAESLTEVAPSPALRPFAENAFRLLELEVDATQSEASKAAGKLASRVAAGKDNPSGMLPFGPRVRTAEQVKAAGKDLAEPHRAAVHALFFPWITALPVDPQALPQVLDALGEELRSQVSPFDLAQRLARRVLPVSKEAATPRPAVEVGGYLFAGDIDLDEAIGPPRPPLAGVPFADERGFLAALERAPSAISNALLAAARLGVGRKLHAAYLRSLLAAADAGEASAWRRLPTAASLFQEVAEEPSAQLILAWRDFVEGRFEPAAEGLARAEADPRLTPGEQTRARVLRIRLHAASEPAAALAELEGLEGPEGAALRGALLLHEGEDERAEAELEGAWANLELRPRIAALRTVIEVERGELEAAQVSLGFAAEGRNASLARARLAHARGEAAVAVERYREVLDEEDDEAPLGSWWGLAVLSEDPEERAAARSWLEEATADSELATPLARAAMADGELDEAESWLVRLVDEPEARQVRALILDRLGRRGEAWALRQVKEEDVRDRARLALEAGRAEDALDDLAGLAIADPLRRRAARAAVVRALGHDAEADPDAVVRRVLGRLSPEELALLDLPANLYRAVREIEEGQASTAVASLRRHLDGADDPLAARLFEVLTASGAEGWARMATFLTSATAKPSIDALVEAGREADPAAWEVAVILAAVEGQAGAPGPVAEAAPLARVGAALLQARRALQSGEWVKCEAALREAAGAPPSQSRTLEKALATLHRARFAEARRSDGEAALTALELESNPARDVLHDRAVWRHALLASSSARQPASLVALLRAWDAACDAGALSHPAHPAEAQVLEGELVAELVRVLATVAPAQAAEVRSAIEDSGSRLGRAALERGGWIAPTRSPGAP